MVSDVETPGEGSGEAPQGLTLTLAEGSPAEPARPDAPSAAQATRLSEAEVQRLLTRLGPLAAPTTDSAQLGLPPSGAPPPLTGGELALPFPPLAAGASGGAGPGRGNDLRPTPPLSVLAVAPEGERPLVGVVSITFSEPMVPLAALEVVDAVEVPATLSPAAAGRWRWIDPRLLVFEAEGRLPAASSYELRIPAGTRAASGARLADEVRTHFSTPPVSVQRSSPSAADPGREQTTDLRPLLVLGFDQAVDAAALLPFLRLTSSGFFGDTDFALRLASAERLDESQREAFSDWPSQRLLLVEPLQDLPEDETMLLALAAGAPSAEGPRRTTGAWRLRFQTRGELSISDRNGTWLDPLRPGQGLSLRFSNALAPDQPLDELLSLDPPTERLSASIWGNGLSVQGGFPPSSSFKLSISGELRDIYGQRLGDAEELTLHTGSVPASYAMPGRSTVLLDPFLPPALLVDSLNLDELDVTLRRVRPRDWPEFSRLASARRGTSAGDFDLGERLRQLELEPGGARDERRRTALGLASALPDDVGHLLVLVEGEVERQPFVAQWLQRTRLGLDAACDGQRLLVWVSSLQDGSPVAGARVGLLSSSGRVLTDADGLAEVPLPEGRQDADTLVAEWQGDSVILPEGDWSWQWRRRSDWVLEPMGTRALWYVFDDRGTYRPGEQVRIKGWLRLRDEDDPVDTGRLPPAGAQVTWTLLGPRHHEWATGEAQLDAAGGFELTLELPDDADPGRARLRLKAAALDVSGRLRGEDKTHLIQVAEFRRPEYEVSVRAGDALSVVGGALELTARAAYYTGGGLRDAQVKWTLRAQDADYAPPGWPEFRFVPESSTDWSHHGGTATPTADWSWEGHTDALGEHRLRAELLRLNPARPQLLTAEAAVSDVNAQRWAGSLSRLVHPGDAYAGLAIARGFVRADEPVPLRLLVADRDGAPVPGLPINVRASRQAWVWDQDGWHQEEADVREASAVSANEPVELALRLPAGGRWSIEVSTRDASGRPALASRSVWVAGGERLPPVPRVELQQLTLLADAERYEPGQRAEVLVAAPFSSGEGLATLSAGPIVWRQRFSLVDGSHVLSLPVSEALMPSAELRVELVGQSVRADPDGQPRPDLPPRPAQAAGQLTLEVSSESQRLALELLPAASEVKPGEALDIAVRVTDAQGLPVPAAQVTLVVADEAVLALAPWVLSDPLAALLPARWYGYELDRSRPLVVLGDPALALPPGWPVQPVPLPREDGRDGEDAIEEGLPMLKSLGYLGGDGYAASAESAAPVRSAMAVPGAARAAAPGAEPVAVRAVFDALAAFEPGLLTDSDGVAQVRVRMPDSLTRYRISAVAVHGGSRAGQGQAALSVRLPLMVRPSPPRLLNLGDRVELPIVVHNESDQPRVVDVVAAVSGLELPEGAGRRVRVPARDRVELRLPVRPSASGRASLSVLAVDHDDPGLADAARLELPVLIPAVKQAFALYGSLDEGRLRLPLLPPDDVVPGFGGLEVSVASTQLAALTDALLAVGEYPYGCAEQRASRVLSVLSLHDVLDAFEVPGRPSPAELSASVASDLEQLLALQNDDGGFPFWRQGKPSEPFLSAHVVHALLLARSHDQALPDAALEQGLAYLDELPQHIASYRWPVPARARSSILAYGLWVQQRANWPVRERALELLSDGAAALDGEALAWLLPLLDTPDSSHGLVAQARAAVRRELRNRVAETAAEAQLTSVQEQGGHLLLHGRRRATALLLDGLLRTEPDSALVPKLVSWLLGQRVAGHWGSTQEDVFALLALRRAFDVLEAETPDNHVRVWAGSRPLLDERFVGRDTTRRALSIPHELLGEWAGAPGPDGPRSLELLLDETGPGRLVWRVGLRLARALEDPAPESRGFSVSRSYESLGDPSDVRRAADGSWQIKRGATLRVRLTMLAPAERHHVALVDHLPAGLEPLDASLAVTGEVPGDEPVDVTPAGFWRCFWWGGPWYDHTSLRDAGAEVFAARLPADVHTYGYSVRATTPGRFVAPPARAEEMYAPETFGHSGADVVLVQ
ncbi:MAG: hypothetical protein DRQ55_08340 [Planctomycetota bacterium]|nr:MAG: hypothetical protein DRQ55_08340 [Planctomycetota bacterium]